MEDDHEDDHAAILGEDGAEPPSAERVLDSMSAEIMDGVTPRLDAVGDDGPATNRTLESMSKSIMNQIATRPKPPRENNWHLLHARFSPFLSS